MTNDSELSFEAALDELQKIVSDLESGKAPLEDSITAYERGMALKDICETKLKAARTKIEQISVSKDGKLSKHEIELEK